MKHCRLHACRAPHEGARFGVTLVTMLASFFMPWLVCDAKAAFTPLTCSTTDRDRWLYTPGLGSTRFDRDLLDPQRYINRTHLSWDVVTNANVKKIFLHHYGVNVEQNYDYLKIVGSVPAQTLLTGVLPAQDIEITPIGWSNANKKLTFTWHTDTSVRRYPVELDTASFICYSPQPVTNSLTIGNTGDIREGLLLGTGDVIYSLPVSPPIRRC